MAPVYSSAFAPPTTNKIGAMGAMVPAYFSMTRKLSASGRSCHVAGICVGVLMYADDLLLILSTCTDLCRMTKICEDEMHP